MQCNVCEEEIETCAECGERFHIGDLIKCTEILGHKLSVKDYPELKLVIENGEVLCEEHHKEKHKK